MYTLKSFLMIICDNIITWKKWRSLEICNTSVIIDDYWRLLTYHSTSGTTFWPSEMLAKLSPLLEAPEFSTENSKENALVVATLQKVAIFRFHASEMRQENAFDGYSLSLFLSLHMVREKSKDNITALNVVLVEIR